MERVQQHKPNQLKQVIASSLYVLLFVVAGLFLLLFIGMNTSLLGNYQLRTVMSGSMTPDIAVGSVVIIDTAVSSDEVAIGDGITYFSESGTSNTVTHRVIDTESGGFITQVDANTVADRGLVTPEQLIGTVNGSVPYVGYAAHAVSSTTGYWLLILIPASFVIVVELRNIYCELTGKPRRRAYQLRPKPRTQDVPPQALVILLVSATFMFVPTTAAQWTDAAINQGNVFVAGEWDAPEQLVINEVYYNVADDKRGPAPPLARYQWIELYNAGDDTVNIKDWQLCRSTVCHSIHPNASIGAGEYALLSHDSAVWARFWEIDRSTTRINLNGAPWHELGEARDMLALKNPDGQIVDAMNWGTLDPTWPNYTDMLWADGIEPASTGASLERREAGLDTDSPGDWMVSPTPSPGDSQIGLAATASYVDISPEQEAAGPDSGSNVSVEQQAIADEKTDDALEIVEESMQQTDLPAQDELRPHNEDDEQLVDDDTLSHDDEDIAE